jgi:mono/diheme cytochrome c family protein
VIAKRYFLATLSVLVGSCVFSGAQERKDRESAAASVPKQEAPARADEARRLPAGQASAAPTKVVASSATSPGVSDESSMRVEGEKRFRTNCGRCHMAPHKFPPRAMATILRHMRVRALITDEDMRLILQYMTQ